MKLCHLCDRIAIAIDAKRNQCCLRDAGLKRRRYHDLRHTFASLLLTAAAPIAYVSEQMGHSSIELTVKRYGHLQPGANRGFINNLPGAKNPTQHTNRVPGVAAV